MVLYGNLRFGCIKRDVGVMRTAYLKFRRSGVLFKGLSCWGDSLGCRANMDMIMGKIKSYRFKALN